MTQSVRNVGVKKVTRKNRFRKHFFLEVGIQHFINEISIFTMDALFLRELHNYMLLCGLEWTFYSLNVALGWI